MRSGSWRYSQPARKLGWRGALCPSRQPRRVCRTLAGSRRIGIVAKTISGIRQEARQIFPRFENGKRLSGRLWMAAKPILGDLQILHQSAVFAIAVRVLVESVKSLPQSHGRHAQISVASGFL